MNAASSPLSPAPSTQTYHTAHSSQEHLTYRKSKELSFELSQHVHIYFEEAMFMQACRLLISIISSDVSGTGDTITVPPPPYLALLATIMIHPSFTSHASQLDKLEQSSSALRLLRLLLKTAGPVNAGFNQAFAFTKYDTGHFQQKDKSLSLENVADDHIHSHYADTDGLWSRAEDFWAVVGWALNCSCLADVYANRWQYYSLWLEFMLDVLEIDWHLCRTTDTCNESLIWHYIELAPGGNVRARRMLRAIFADGSHSALKEFREIFRRELRERSELRKMEKRKVDLDIEQDIWGDYMNHDSESSSESDTGGSRLDRRSHKRLRTRTPTHRTSIQSLRPEFDNNVAALDERSASLAPLASSLGPPNAMEIRLRLLQLLSDVAHHEPLTASSPATFPAPAELCTLYVEFIRPLPLSIFQQFIFRSSSTLQTLSSDVQATICEELLDRSIEHSTTSRSAVPSFSEDGGRMISQRRLEAEYLPYAAVGLPRVDANARVSLLLESLIRLLRSRDALRKTPLLERAVEHGIQRRLDAATGELDGGNGGGGGPAKRKARKISARDDDFAWITLKESAARMQLVVRGLS